MRDNKETEREGIKFTHSRDLLDNENRRHHGRES